MATQTFTYTGVSRKYQPKGKTYKFNAKNKKMLLNHYKTAVSKGQQPKFNLPKGIRYNPYTNSFGSTPTAFKSKVASQSQRIKYQKNKQIVRPKLKEIRKQVQSKEFQYRRPTQIKVPKSDEVWNKKNFTFKMNPNLSLRENIRRRLQQVNNNRTGTMYNATVYKSGNPNGTTTASRSFDFDKLIDDAVGRVQKSEEQYENNEDSSEYIADKSLEDAVNTVSNITIRRWTPKPQAGNQLIGSGSVNSNIIEGQDFININIPASKNCFYCSLAILNEVCSKRTNKQKLDNMLSLFDKGWSYTKKFIQEKGTSIKNKFRKAMKVYNETINTDYADITDLTKHVNYSANGKYGKKDKGWAKKIVVLDCKFQVKEIIEPENDDGVYKSKLPTYYLMLYKNHYTPLIHVDDLNKHGHSKSDWDNKLKLLQTEAKKDVDTYITKNTYQQIVEDSDLHASIQYDIRTHNKENKDWNKANPNKIQKEAFDYRVINKMIRDEYCKQMQLQNKKPYRYELFNKDFDYKYAAYDIEASNQHNLNIDCEDSIKLEEELGTNPFKCYMIGLAWFEYPEIMICGEDENTFMYHDEREVDMQKLRYIGQREYCYKYFEGMDCIKQFFDFLEMNSDKFNDYTLYAHNGANFDMPLLFRENLCDNENWKINNVVELNGGYIGVEITDGDNTIKFKDSLRHLTGSLDDLCKEINTKHKKKPELFSPKEITIDNWNTPKFLNNLREYLSLDCLSLLDLVDIYSHTLYYQLVPNLEEYETKDLLVLEEGLNPKCSCGATCRGTISKSRKDVWFWACGGNCRFADTDRPKFIRDCTYEETKAFEKIAVKKVLDRQCKINMSECYTSSSFGKKLLYKHYLPHNRGAKYRISNLGKEKEQRIRKGYFGGRTEAFVLGSSELMGHDKIYYYDETSKYPAEMVNNKIPYGIPHIVQAKPEDNYTYNSVYSFVKKNFGFYKCRIKSTEFSKKFKPLIGYKDPHSQRLTFQYYDDWFEVDGLFSQEIMTGLKYNLYEFQLIECITFKSDYILKNIAKGLFDNKAKAKAEGNSVLAKSNKITVNSVYGLFGLNTYDRDGITIIPVEDVAAWEKLTKQEGVFVPDKYAQIGKYRFCRTRQDIDIKDVNVSIASSITSYARCSLWEYLFMTELNGGKVLMCDTDSCISTLDLHSTKDKIPKCIKMKSGWLKGKTIKFNTDMAKRFCWDGTGEELGSWKSECQEDLEGHFEKQWCKVRKLDKKKLNKLQKTHMKTYRKECMKEQREADGGNPYFDKLIMTGCKQYYLNKKCFDGSTIETKKLKGLKQDKNEDNPDKERYIFETAEDMEKKIKGVPLGEIHYQRLIEDKAIFQYQEQFKNPLANHISDNNPFAINIKSTGKAFRMVYTKGRQVVHEGKGIEIQAWTYPQDYAMDKHGVMQIKDFDRVNTITTQTLIATQN